MRVHLLVSGRVQGVGFREFARRTARHCAVGGWVRNLADGRVEVVADGERSALDAFVTAVSGGPPGAFVRDVHQDWQPRSRSSRSERSESDDKEFVIR